LEFINSHNRAQFKFARSLTAFHAKSFYLSAVFLPREKRWATYALYGFCRYVDNLIDSPRTRSKAEIIQELDYIAKEIKIAYRTGESEHPVLGPFVDVARHYSIPEDLPLELIEGVRMDTHKQRYENFEELYLFAYRVAGVVGLMMTPLLGYRDATALLHAEKLGIAMQLTNILRDIQEDKNMDRIYLPLDEINRFQVNLQDFFNEKFSPEIKELVKFQVERAHQYYDQSDAGIKLLDRGSQFAIYSASKIYRGILKKIESRNYNPFLGRVFVSQRKKVFIISKEILRSKTMSLAPRLNHLLS
jgi:phytoene synthase